MVSITSRSRNSMALEQQPITDTKQGDAAGTNETLLSNNPTLSELTGLFQRTVQLSNLVSKDLDEQKRRNNTTHNLVLLGFVFLLITVAAIVISFLIFQIQFMNQSYEKTQDTLNSINERLDNIDEPASRSIVPNSGNIPEDS